MDYKKIGPTALLGFGAIAAGVVAVLLGRSRGQAGQAAQEGQASSNGSPAAAPLWQAEEDKHFQERPGTPANEHVPTDLLSDAPVTIETRAPDAFRPDPTAVPTAEEREGLRPATGPAPTLVADRGTLNS
ncbi:MAG TPA: hypothetical protein VF606_12515 [Geminicoccaceae bacterium]|jgi:hypothetical protein